jgi:hypothetical protein
MALIEHPAGDYLLLPGIAPYSCGVVSARGFEIAHVTLHVPVPYREGFGLIESKLADQGRPIAALCGVELRCPRPYTFAGFADFNAGYAEQLKDWGLFVDGINPVARTNVAPEIGAPAEPLLYGFSFTRPCEAGLPATFVVSGAGELPEGVLSHEAIVRVGETSPVAMIEKAAFVMYLMESRLWGLGRHWADVTAIDIYTVHSLDMLLPDVILPRTLPGGVHGVRWFYSRPPVEAIEFEMDLRGVRSELRI